MTLEHKSSKPPHGLTDTISMHFFTFLLANIQKTKLSSVNEKKPNPAHKILVGTRGGVPSYLNKEAQPPITLFKRSSMISTLPVCL